ncbi:hypothetical protein BC830DRAFT_1168289 [Chytriomyces sp. MP71]|nr:hypothetical protein BC830DRAFT_1168289 [Chytriomyces sp. MP71]
MESAQPHTRTGSTGPRNKIMAWGEKVFSFGKKKELPSAATPPRDSSLRITTKNLQYPARQPPQFYEAQQKARSHSYVPIPRPQRNSNEPVTHNVMGLTRSQSQTSRVHSISGHHYHPHHPHSGNPPHRSHQQHQPQNPSTRHSSASLSSPSAVANHERQREMWTKYRSWLEEVQSTPPSARSTISFDLNHGGGSIVGRPDARRVVSGTPSEGTVVSHGAKEMFHDLQNSYSSESYANKVSAGNPHLLPNRPPRSPTSITTTHRESLLSDNTAHHHQHYGRSPSPSVGYLHSAEVPPVSPRRRVVSFGGASMRSFDSSSPTSVQFEVDDAHHPERERQRSNSETSLHNSYHHQRNRSNSASDILSHPQEQGSHLQRSASTDGHPNGKQPRVIRIHDPDLIPLPPHHKSIHSHYHHHPKRIESLVLRPSNDFITALLAYKTYLAAHPVAHSPTSPSSPRTGSDPAKRNTFLPDTIPRLPIEIQRQWEIALRLRIPALDWTQLLHEVLEASIAFGNAPQRRTYHEAKLYWDLVWRGLSLGCTRPGGTPCARCGPAAGLETFVHFLWTCPVAIVLWRRLEWVLGTIAEGEVRRERAIALRKYGGGSRRDYESWYGLNEDGRVEISLVDVLFCFPRVRRMADPGSKEVCGPSDRYIKTVTVMHATALMSLLEARAYPREEDGIVWSFFLARYEARREVETDQRRI